MNQWDQIKQFIMTHKKIVMVSVTLIIFLMSLIGIYFYSGVTNPTSPTSTLSSIDKSSKINQSGQSGEAVHGGNQVDHKIIVDVKGAVNHPGVYKVSDSARIEQIVQLAGGFNKSADQLHINLAQKVADGQVVYIPSKDEKTPDIYQSQQQSVASSSTATTINLNTATVEELQKLDGIGQKKAEQIVAYRTENNGFKQIEDIKKVSGIGDKRFEKIKDMLSI